MQRLSAATLAARCRPTSRGRATTAPRSRPASCISASARSSARIRRCTPRPRSPPATAAGASSARACARPRCAMRSSRRTGSIRSAVRGADGERLQVIGAIKEVLVAPEDPRGAAARASAIRRSMIVTLTVTEKGYCYDPATAALDESPSRYRARPRPTPRSRARAPGFLVEALRRRREARCPFLHGAVLRQPSAQRPHGRGDRGALRRAARPGACRLHPQRGRVSLDDGRPHHAGDHR